MKRFKGTIASHGIVIAPPITYQKKDYLADIPEKCDITDAEKEKVRLREAYNILAKRLEGLKETALDEEKELIDAEIMMLETMAMEAEELIGGEKICAELAVKKIYEKYEILFKESGSELINLRLYDLMDLASKLVAILRNAVEREKELYKGKIIISDEMYPLDFTILVKHGIKGMITRKGGITSHVAILARSYGIPYLIVPDFPVPIGLQNEIILDAINGYIIIDPDEKTMRKYRDLEARYEEIKRIYSEEALKKAVTKDGEEIKVLCNIGSVEEARLAEEYGCEGIGLLRMEFLYMDRKTPPTDKEIEDKIKRILELVKGEVIVRAPDIGADKPVEFLRLEHEDNPQLGVRGIRLLLQQKEILLKPFLKAVVRLAHKYGDRLKVMVPMVSVPEELKEFYDELIETVKELKEKGEEASIPILGIMVETPAAVKTLDLFSKVAPIKFASIGSNDLTQYVLAADRGNPSLGNLYNELQPPVLRTIKEAVDKASTSGIELSICGEMANKIHAIPLLLGLGLKKLSVPISLVGRTKYVIRKLEISGARKLAEKAVKELVDKKQVYDSVNKLLEKYRIVLV